MAKVVFRKWKDGEVIALFPDDMNLHDGTVTSYMHVGQHGAADYAGVVAVTRPATEAEYRPLLCELRSVEYDDLWPARRARPKFITR